jgi:spore maturation protein CgeB
VKIFFSGGLGGNWKSGWQRCRTLKALGHDVTEFDQDDYVASAARGRVARLLTGVRNDPAVVDRCNRDFLRALDAARPDAAWLEWPVLFRAETIRQARDQHPRCVFVSFQDDNPFGQRAGEGERWRLFLEALPEYDLHFVKRESDRTEYERRGARKTSLLRHGVFADLFFPMTSGDVPDGLRQDVSFVGTPLDGRSAIVSELLGRHQVPLRVYGGRWERTWVYRRHRDYFRPLVRGEDYRRVICGSRISLGFVSSSNHDEHTMRTFEIPGCGGFLLAERTRAHQELFVEGEEAEFFGSIDECADKIRFYLKNEAARRRIAEGGHRRCLESDYSLGRQVREAVERIEATVAMTVAA